MTYSVRKASARAENLPYRYQIDGITFGVDEFRVDDGDPGSPDYDDRSVPLYKYPSWDEADISASLTITERTVDHVFNGDPPFNAKLIVGIDSPATQLRYESVAEPSPFTAGRYETEISLEHDLLRGAVTLTPRLVRTEDSDDGLPYAPNEGMRVAGGDSWEVHVDEPEEDGEGFPFVYRDFSDGDFPADAVHTIRRDPSEPAVLVNSRHDPIVDVLQTETFYSFDAYLKDVIKAELGTSTWMQLVLHTAATIAEGGEPEYDWQEGVVEEIVPYLYDDDLDYQTAVQRLGEAASNPNELRNLVFDLNEAVQLYTEQAAQLNRFIDEDFN
jgi:hypothetical protein